MQQGLQAPASAAGRRLPRPRGLPSSWERCSDGQPRCRRAAGGGLGLRPHYGRQAVSAAAGERQIAACHTRWLCLASDQQTPTDQPRARSSHAPPAHPPPTPHQPAPPRLLALLQSQPDDGPRQECDTCHGSGTVECWCSRWSDDDRGCSTCRGSGRMVCSSCRGGGTAVPIEARLIIRKDQRTDNFRQYK